MESLEEVMVRRCFDSRGMWNIKRLRHKCYKAVSTDKYYNPMHIPKNNVLCLVNQLIVLFIKPEITLNNNNVEEGW